MFSQSNENSLKIFERMLSNEPSLLSNILRENEAKLSHEEKLQLCVGVATANVDYLRFLPLKETGLIPEEDYEDIYIVAIQKNVKNLQHIPESDRTKKIYLTAVRRNADVLRDITNDFIKKYGVDFEKMPDMVRKEYLEIAEAAIEKNPSAIKYIPQEIMTHSLCVKAVSKDELTLQYVPDHIIGNDVNHEIREAANLSAVRRNGLALEYIPLEQRSYHVCLEAVKRNGEAIVFVPPEIMDKQLCEIAIASTSAAFRLIPTEYIDEDMSLVAVKANGFYLKYVPEKYKTKAVCKTALLSSKYAWQFLPKLPSEELQQLCLEVVSVNGLLLANIPEKQRTSAVHRAAVTQNGLALEAVDESFAESNPEEYIELCKIAVSQNGLALEFVPEHLKEIVIDAVSPEVILSFDYRTLQYFPSTDKYSHAISDFFAGIKHVVVSEDDELVKDHEIRDIYLVYADSPKRKGRTIHVNSSDVDELFETLNKYQYNDQKYIHLTLLGHANQKSVSIGGMKPRQVSELLKSNRSINHVTLLGCNTAKAKKLEEEKAMIRAHLIGNQKGGRACGFILLNKKPMHEDYADLLRSVGLSETYILVEVEKNNKYELIHIEQQMDSIESREHLLNQAEMKSLKNVFMKGKDFNFPEDEKPSGTRRNIERPLSINELQRVSQIMVGDKVERFDKIHPEYKRDKLAYPFLKGIAISTSEAESKLKTSLLQKMVTAIKSDDGIVQDVVVKGYTRSLHVDTAMKGMVVTRAHLYPSHYTHSTFSSRQDNINRKKLAEDRKKAIRKMKEKPLEGKSYAKSIKVAIKK